MASKFLIAIIYLLGVAIVFAAPHPPSPGFKKPPSPPGLPVNEDLLIVFIMALLYGLYVIFRYKLKTKTPI